MYLGASKTVQRAKVLAYRPAELRTDRMERELTPTSTLLTPIHIEYTHINKLLFNAFQAGEMAQ